jgi:hypothetical protein
MWMVRKGINGIAIIVDDDPGTKGHLLSVSTKYADSLFKLGGIDA